jgi:hypothetical protein
MALLETANLAYGILVGALAVDMVLERRRLSRFVSAFGDHRATPRLLALEVAGRLFAHRHLDDDPPYLLKVLAPLGASPGALIRRGGCCSGMSRLYIHVLSQLGIPAHQITLYHRSGLGRHCLVEVRLPDGPLIADPCYGFHYAGPAGGALGLADLQRGAQPQFVALPHSDKRAYPSHEYYDFDLTLSKTANWSLSRFRMLVYAFLKTVTRGRIDRLRVPVLLEWPQVLLALFAAMGLAALHVIFALIPWLGAQAQ